MKNTKNSTEKNLSLIFAAIIAIIAVSVIMLSMSGCIGPETPPVNETVNETTGEKVTGENVAKIKLVTGDGKTSEEYVSAGSGKYSYENEIIGMIVGDKKTVTDSKPIAVRLTHEPEENTVYVTSGGEIKVFNVTDTEILIGPKLAGETLNFSIKIKNAEDVLTSRKTCLEKYNVSADTVGFLHRDGCGFCTKMKPFITELENNTVNSYNFLWINTADSEKMKIGRECLADIFDFGQGVPQFACPSNGQWKLGAVFQTVDEMKNFAEECKKAAEAITETPVPGASAVKTGDKVEVEYVGKLMNGETFDEGTISFVVGSGQMITGFDEAVVGMKINESKEVIIPPEKGYGYPEETTPREMLQDVPIDQFKGAFNEEPVLNKEYSNPQVVPWQVKVVEIKTEDNEYTIEILDVLTKEEFSDVMAKKKPEVEVFVMSHCPYGTQVEKGIIPVQELLGDKANIHIRFVHYIMHGQQEANEQTRQYCIDKEQEDKFWSYLACFLDKSDSAGCLDKEGIDKNKLRSCMDTADKEFNISGDLAAGQQYPRFRIHEDLSKQYGVQGSPTLVIDGKMTQANRDPESLKNAICDAFTIKPDECEQALSTTPPSPGFGFTGTGGS